MKNLLRLSILIIVIAYAANICAADKNLNNIPLKPKPGDTITIEYNPAGTNLEKSTDIKMIVYFYSKNLDNTEEFVLSKNKDLWIGKFTPPDSTRGVVIQFASDEIKDNNNKKGYFIRMYDATGNPVPGSEAGLGVGYFDWFQLPEIDTDPQKAYECFENEFSKNPGTKKDYLNYFLASVSTTQNEKANEIILAELKNLEAGNNLSENDLEILVNWYDRLKQPEKSQPYKDKLLENYPKGQFAISQKYAEYKNQNDISGKIKVFKNLCDLAGSNNYSNYMQSDIIRIMIGQGDYSKVKEFIDSLKEPSAMNYNNLAWDMYEKNADMNTAEEVCKNGVDAARFEFEKPKNKKPAFQTTREWNNSRKASLGNILDSYGAILFKLGKKEESLKALSEAVELTNRTQNEINERYAQVLIDLGQDKKAKEELENYIVTGKSTPGMKDLLKQSYTKINSSKEGFDNYFDKIDAKAKEKSIAKIRSLMINEPAPQFTLSDLNGNNVSLSDFKGKKVVVDFWATWCGPCISSFPGMKTAVEKFETSKNVKFLFINTWETADNKKQNASEFIQKNGYPFQVLLDDKNEVISSFKVSGIPTKFFVDSKSNIRFKSVGFGGNPEEMVNEIELILSQMD